MSFLCPYNNYTMKSVVSYRFECKQTIFDDISFISFNKVPYINVMGNYLTSKEGANVSINHAPKGALIKIDNTASERINSPFG